MHHAGSTHDRGPTIASMTALVLEPTRLHDEGLDRKKHIERVNPSESGSRQTTAETLLTASSGECRVIPVIAFRVPNRAIIAQSFRPSSRTRRLRMNQGPVEVCLRRSRRGERSAQLYRHNLPNLPFVPAVPGRHDESNDTPSLVSGVTLNHVHYSRKGRQGH
jgi:hypothetical protein